MLPNRSTRCLGLVQRNVDKLEVKFEAQLFIHINGEQCVSTLMNYAGKAGEP